MTIDPLMTRDRIVIPPRKSLSQGAKRRIWEASKGLCHICGEPVPIDGPSVEWEHKIPRGLMGELADDEGNLAPAHKTPCHEMKTKTDQAMIAQAKRQERLTMPKVASLNPIISRGFSKDGPKAKWVSKPFPKKR